VSYRKLDNSIEKAIDIYNKLITANKVHSSPLEHAATPFTNEEYNLRLETMNKFKSILSKQDLEQFLYKRNFKGWSQYRTMIPNETFN
jgi:hypothetical protein